MEFIDWGNINLLWLPHRKMIVTGNFITKSTEGQYKHKGVQDVCFNVNRTENFIAHGNHTLNIVELSARIKAVKPLPKHLLSIRDPDCISTLLQHTNFPTKDNNATIDFEAKSVNNLMFYAPCIIPQYVYKPTSCTKFLWLDFIFH